MRGPILMTVVLLACGGGGSGGVTPPPAGVGAVQGRVALENDDGIANVTVQLTRTGATARTALTASGTGAYSFTGVETGAWTVTAQLPSGFEPVGSLTASVQVTANQTAQVPAIRLRQSGPPGQEPFVIAIRDNFFDPTPAAVAVGRTVRWVNTGAQAHNSVGPSWGSGNLNPGGSFEHQFTTAGTFDYQCTLHPEMTARIIVQ